MFVFCFCFYCDADPRDLHVLTHSFPTRRSADLGNVVRAASEIASRIYLTIGFTAVLGIALLAATSFAGAIRRLRRNWKRLHKLVYPLTALELLHFSMQSKADVSEPALISGILVGLLMHRLAPRNPRPAASIPAGLAGAAAGGPAAPPP